MKLIPRRRRDSALALPFGLEDVFQHVWGNGEDEYMSHLPEVFQGRPALPVNVSETEDSFCITMDCPGLEEEDFNIELMGRKLVISGERKWEEDKEEKEFRRVESQYGKFSRIIQLPENTSSDSNKVEAIYKKGVLKVTVPKVNKTPASRIPVQGA